MANHAAMKLGRKPKRVDDRTIQLKKVLALPPNDPLMTPRPLVDYAAAVKTWPMYANDQYSDCGLAAVGHMIQAWTAANGAEVVPDLDELLRVYFILSPDDSGIVLLDFLNYWRQNPVAGVQIPAYVAVDPLNKTLVELAMDWFGGLYSGVALPNTAKTQDIWDVTKPSADSRPNSWGEHCLPWLRYVSPNVYVPQPEMMTRRCITWGATKDATEDWCDKYTDELYAICSPDWFGPSGNCPPGINLAALEGRLKIVTA